MFTQKNGVTRLVCHVLFKQRLPVCVEGRFYFEGNGFQLDAPVCMSKLAPRIQPGGVGVGGHQLPTVGKTCLGTFFPINNLMKENKAPPKLTVDF